MTDGAMADIEGENTALGDVPPKMYGRIQLDRSILGQLIDTVSNITAGGGGSRSKDVLGRVYGYFLPRFASREDKKGGEFHTPPGVARLPAGMLEPCDGRVYYPRYSSAGMLVQSGEFIRGHAAGNGSGGRARGTIRIFGQESNHAAWRLAKMNLAIRGIEGKIENGDSLRRDPRPDLEADFIPANPRSTPSRGAANRCRRTSGGSTAYRRQATPTLRGCST